MKTTRTILIAEMLGCVLVSLAIVILYETDTLLPGGMSENGNAEFLLTSFMELFTIFLIPLALRLFKFDRIGQEISGNEKGLLIWGSVRLGMLCIPMMINTLLYYWFMNVAFGYMGIIGLICLIFIYPTTDRCLSESGGNK